MAFIFNCAYKSLSISSVQVPKLKSGNENRFQIVQSIRVGCSLGYFFLFIDANVFF